MEVGWKLGYPANLSGPNSRVRVRWPPIHLVSWPVSHHTRLADDRRRSVDLRHSGGQTGSYSRSPLAGPAGDGRDVYDLGTRLAQDDRQHLVCDPCCKSLLRVAREGQEVSLVRRAPSPLPSELGYRADLSFGLIHFARCVPSTMWDFVSKVTWALERPVKVDKSSECRVRDRTSNKCCSNTRAWAYKADFSSFLAELVT